MWECAIRLGRLAVLGTVIMLFAATEVLADESYHKRSLKGLLEVKVVVGDLDDDDRKCGLKADDLKRSLLLPIRAYTKIKETDPNRQKLLPPIPQALLSVMTVRSEDICVHHIEITVNVAARVELPHTSRGFYTVGLWQVGTLLAHSGSRPDRVRDAVEGLAKRFAESWQSANPN
jgi:hypothetical protein